MKNCIYLFLFLLPGSVLSQLVVPVNTSVGATKGTEIIIITANSIVNNNSFDFSSTKLAIELNGTTQAISGNLVVSRFSVAGEGTKNINGNVTITDRLQLNSGILKPSATAKLLFTGLENGISEGNNNSYCDGTFYSSGGGKRFFPLGAAGIFSPAELESVSDEVGIKLNNGSALLTFDTADISSINQTRFWEIKTDPTKLNTRVALSLNDATTFLDSEGSVTIVQADNVGGKAQNLGSSSSSDVTIISRENVSASILALGKEKKITVKIHDLITPTGSAGFNDRLYIENINKFDHNKVTLLDRWGTRVNEWIDFTNDTAYDFSKLSAGNYICVVEYGNVGKANQVKQQMVTVLKTN